MLCLNFTQQHFLVFLPYNDRLKATHKRCSPKTLWLACRTSFCLRIIPSSRSSNEVLKSFILSSSNRANSIFINLLHLSNSCLHSLDRLSALVLSITRRGGDVERAWDTYICNLIERVADTILRNFARITSLFVRLFDSASLWLRILPLGVATYARNKGHLNFQSTFVVIWSLIEKLTLTELINRAYSSAEEIIRVVQANERGTNTCT